MKLKNLKRPQAAVPTAAKQYLFVYAQLLHDNKPLDVVARGILKVRHDTNGSIDGAAKFDEHGIVHGQLHPVSMSTLRHLDSSEKPEYKRIAIETSKGPAWAYQYVLSNWGTLPPINSGDFKTYKRDMERQDNVKSQIDGGSAPEDVTEVSL